MIRAAAILLAGGSGTRVGADRNKVLLPLAGRPILAWSRETLRLVPEITHVVMVCKPQEREAVSALADPTDLIVDGGIERHDSEWQAIQALASAITAADLDVVALHDGARPLAGARLWSHVIETASRTGAAVPSRPLAGVANAQGYPVPFPLGAVATPQAFGAPLLLASYQAAARDGFRGTDTAACVTTYADLTPTAVPTTASNLKVTYPEDLALAESVLRDAGELGGIPH